MKKYSKRLIGVILLGFLALFICFNTTAEESVACKNVDEQNIEEKYNLQLEKVAEGQYKISMAGDASDIDGGIFKVVGPGEYEGMGVAGTINAVDTIALIKKNQPAYFNATPATASDGAKVLAVKVKMIAGSTALTKCDYEGTLIFIDYGDSVQSSIYSGNNTTDNKNSIYNEGSICYNFYTGNWNSEQFTGIKEADFNAYNYTAAAGLMIGGKSAQSIYQTTLSYCFQQKVTIGAEYSESDLANMIGNAITYTKSRTKTIAGTNKTFADLFAEIRDNANTVNKSGKEAKDDAITCDWEKTASTGDANDYYKNKNYYYKSEKVDSITVQYTYHYAPGDTQTSAAQEVCTRTCSEAVKVEYGPPIASKAGLCFEYKVKVTSYVECTADVVLDPPTDQTTYCSPVAYCHEKNYKWEGHQAGPTEEFDSCVQECDGGKYTSACSKKCYKQVYTSSKLQLSLSYETALVERLNSSETTLEQEVSNCIANSSDGGCYYWSGSEIRWKSTYQNGKDFQNDVRALGRWYREVGWYVDDVGENQNYDVSANGIKTKKTSSSTGHCQDICTWQTDKCKKGMYLNPQSAKEDNQNNAKLYQSKVAQCEAAATCSSSTAEFSISINYDSYDSTGTKKVTTINFPYTTLAEKNNKDYIASLGDKTTSENTSSNKNSTILSYDGCYQASTEKNWYLTEWSFPGTYIHNKTGEISFVKPDVTDGWYYDDKKFCMPLDAESVNTKWWEWYKINNMQYTCYDKDDINTELQGKSGTSNGYNINAKTTKFGYFGWEFDIKCFYALRNEVCDVDEKSCCSTSTCTGDSCENEVNGVKNYMFRSIDTSNIFPNAPITGVVDETKREIGFNWTTKATNTKNQRYLVNPTALIESIQEKSATLYSDEDNLDYQFYLTPETLNKIKSYNKTYSYGTWNGKMEIRNGIYVYYSNLWGSSDSNVEKTLDLRSYGSVLETGTPGENNE